MNINTLQSLASQQQQRTLSNSPTSSLSCSVTDDLSSEIDESKADCLNQSDNHSVKHLLINTRDTTTTPQSHNSNYYLESSADEQLLIYLPFKNKVNIRSIGFWAPDTEECPSTIKLYINRSNVDFDDVDAVKPTEVIHLKQGEAAGNGKIHQLRFVNFRNVVSLTIFVAENHGAETSILQKLKLTGTIITDRSGEQLQKME